jgi:dihydrodipicolinate synthase/N-acetylneuraminate lyase
MRTGSIEPADLAGVFAVPPLARVSDPSRMLDFHESARLRDHILAGGVTRLLYGGNAFLYHVTLREYEDLLAWLADAPAGVWAIPGLGPSFGRALDQAVLLRRYRFPCVMLLPCGDPRDAPGLEQGAREVVDAAGSPLMLYLKDVHTWGTDAARGLDAVGRLVDAGVAVAIKYAVVRDNPADDAYLGQLLARVDPRRVISGIGERPAVVHMSDWGLPGFTTGSGCIAPVLSQSLFTAMTRGDVDAARQLRESFLPLEDLRDAWGPARVLHEATALAGIAETGPIVPFVSGLDERQRAALRPIARALFELGIALHG